MMQALLPLKDLVRAKTRLAGILAPFERRALAQAMVEDVLSVLSEHPALDGTLLLSDDSGADLLARKYGVDVLVESSLPVSGLNNVVSAGCKVLHDRGTENIMIVHSDLPQINHAALTTLFEAYEKSDRMPLISPDRRGEGTNILLTPSSALPDFRYGPNSCHLHSAAFAEMGRPATLIALQATGLDVDFPDDLLDLWRSGRAGAHTLAFLQSDRIAQRLALLDQATASADQGSAQNLNIEQSEADDFGHRGDV